MTDAKRHSKVTNDVTNEVDYFSSAVFFYVINVINVWAADASTTYRSIKGRCIVGLTKMLSDSSVGKQKVVWLVRCSGCVVTRSSSAVDYIHSPYLHRRSSVGFNFEAIITG